MATYTPNYGLHQWVPEDQFRREDFNQDFQKIDAAIKAAENKAASGDEQVLEAVQAVQSTAEWALESLEPLSYNVYNLLLQNYYEGLDSGFKKALVFDGFLDKDGIESTTSGLTWNPAEKNVILQAAGVSGQEDGFETRRLVEIPTTTSLKQSFTAPSTGTITAVELYFVGNCTITIEQNGTVLGSAVGNGRQSNLITKIPISAKIERGSIYQICLLAKTVECYVYSGGNNMNFGYRLTITPTIVTNGTLVTTQHSLGTSYQRASAWVRHSGGNVSLSLYNQQSGSWVSMPSTGTRTTVTTKGVSCVETAFCLTSVPVENQNVKLRLAFSTSSGVNAMLYDYGVAVF